MPKPPKPGRCVRDEADARALLEQLRLSTLPLKTWCRDKGLNAGSLYWWRAKLAPRSTPPVSPPITLLELTPPPTPLKQARYEIGLPNHFTLAVDHCFDEAVLKKLLTLVATC